MEAPSKRARPAMRAGRGQLVIPALFAIPTLVLFLFLIFETAKVSREKIRMQFAVDTAAFIEMTNYSDLLNRSAYVNGAFPMRVFRESYPGIDIEATNSTAPSPLLTFLYNNDVFPDFSNDPGSSSNSQMPNLDVSQSGWGIRYSGKTPSGSRLNGATGPEAMGGKQFATHVFRAKDAFKFYVFYEAHAQPLWNFFVSVYDLLGSVADAQYQVYKRLTGLDNSFYKKAWMLNTGLPRRTADSSAFAGRDLDMGCVSTTKSGTYGRVPAGGGFMMAGGDPFKVQGFGDDTEDTMNAANHSGAPGQMLCTSGLFRLAVLQSKSKFDRVHMTDNRSGIEVKQRWKAPSNYFQVNLNSPQPEVHVRVGIVKCPTCQVWNEEGSGPTPTPKFQTRTVP